MRPYVLVSGDFVRTGGMDVANYWLARHLSEAGHAVHLVAHLIAEELNANPNIHFHPVPRPLRSSLLGEPLLDRAGRRWGASVEKKGGRTLSNGGNCSFHGGNWVHYVHAAYQPGFAGSTVRRTKASLARRRYLSSERSALRGAKLIIANSQRTRSDVASALAIAPEKIHAIYYGSDPDAFHPRPAADKEKSRARLGLPSAVPIVLFIGSIADQRKGFAHLLGAWRRLCDDPSWDAWLVVAGAPPDIAAAPRVRFLGFRQDIPQVLAACDLLVSPALYEAYGLAVHEALCSGVPAFVTADAGVAERYPPSLHHLLLPRAADEGDLSQRLHHWRSRMGEYCAAVAEFSETLRARTWSQACSEIVELMEAAG